MITTVLFAAAMLVGGRAVPTAAAQSDIPMHGWKLLPPVPDPIGFVGMFAGVLNGRLIAGGGAQFDKPSWLKGKKIFSDRIYTLAPGAETWLEHEARLPAPMAYFAMATAPDVIYLIGGTDEKECLRSIFELRAKGDDLVLTRLVDFMEPVALAGAAISGGRLYVAGGRSTPESTTPSSKVWSLDLADPKGSVWRREPDLPGTGVILGAMTAAEGQLYFFGGISFDAASKARPSAKAFRLDPREAKWTALPDLPEPRVGAVSPCLVLPGNRIFLIGGYAEVFAGPPREHPGFSQQTYYFDLADGRWRDGPLLPAATVLDRDKSTDAGPAPMVVAPGVIWEDHVVVVSGEVRPNARTRAVLAWPLGP